MTTKEQRKLLRRVPTPALVAELDRRGVETKTPEQVDATRLIDELGRLAGTCLPEMADVIRDLRVQCANWEARAVRAETQVSLLAASIVTDELSSIESRELAVAAHTDNKEFQQ